jgi:FKBP-type peptidyl-prolyl cis-trans isomerase 2
MDIGSNTMVTMDYKVSKEDGEILESSEKTGPIDIVYGVGSIVPGLEREMIGMKIGDKKNVTVSPAEAYGERSDEAVGNVPRDSFPKEPALEVGMMFNMRKQDGQILFATIMEIMEEELKMDFNHPLAGETLKFDIEIKDVKEAPEADECGCGCSCGGDSGPPEGGCTPGDCCS